MFLAKGGHAGVVHLRAGDPSAQQEGSKPIPVVFRFRKQDQARRFQPGCHLVNGFLQWRGGSVNSGMGNDGEKFMNTWPGDRPGGIPLG